VNFMKYKAKCKVLHLGRGNPKHKYSLRGEQIESSPVQKDLGILVDEKLSMTQHCTLTTQKASCIPGCIKSSVACWSRPRGGPQKWSEGWNTSPMRKG